MKLERIGTDRITARIFFKTDLRSNILDEALIVPVQRLLVANIESEKISAESPGLRTAGVVPDFATWKRIEMQSEI